MPSERIQRQIDTLLDEAEAAVRTSDWKTVRNRVEAALAFDPENADARSFLDAAARADAGTPSAAPSQPTEAPSAAPPLPTAFAAGRYTVRAFLGEGAKKRVYLAHDTRLDRDVAFALIKTDGLDADGVARIRREAQAMGRLGDHTHIVTVFDAGEEQGAPFIVSQHMSGGSVEDLLNRTDNHRLAADNAMKIAAQVADALAHAHARGIVHRDLKPGNVWLDAEGNAALGDFGLAIAIDRSRMTMQGMMVGTVAYMAPEQALGRAPDARSDLYSLGAMLYEMVAGRPPFLGDDAVGVISQHINTAPVAPSWHEPTVPSPLETLIVRLLAKSPDDRPQAAQEVANELRQVLTRSTITEHPDGVGEGITDLRQLDWGRFVGRRDEMTQLKAALESSLSGKVALAFIAGEPGIGKTRLAEEFSVYAELRGAQVLTGRSYEGEASVPYRPFIEALRQYARSQPDGDLRQQMGPGAPEIATMISDVRQRFPDIQEAPKLEADAERLRLFDSITTFLRNASVSQPIVLLLDDVHWSDKPSLLLLQHIARHAEHERLLLMATYRDVELDRTHPLAEALPGFRRMERFTRISLRGLVQDEVYELLTSIESDEETAQGRGVLAQAIWRETEGNPFFIKEVLQHLVETGKIRHENGHWSAGGLTVDDLGIPEGVREVIGRRLSRLSDGSNAALTRASAMTRGFTWEQLRAVNASMPEDQLLDLLDEALRAQLVAERKGETPVVYDFTHALIRQTLYEELSTPRRVLLHREIGLALEQLYASNLDAHVGELAYHFFHAAAGGDAATAIDYCTRAGDRAAELNGHDDAIAHYERALQLIQLMEAGEHRRCELLIQLGDAQWKSGKQADALSTFRTASEIADRVSSAEMLAAAAIGFAEASFLVFGDLELRGESERRLSGALRALGDVETSSRVRALGLRARAGRPRNDKTIISTLSSSGYSVYLGGRDEGQVQEARTALEIARRIGDHALIAFALHCLRGCLWRAGNRSERLLLAHEMADEAKESRDANMEILALAWIVIDELDHGDLDAIEQTRQRLNQLSGLTRRPFERWLQIVSGTAIPFLRGDFARGEEMMNAAFAIGQEGNVPEALAAFGAQLSTVRVLQGRSAEVAPLFRQLFADSPGSWAYGCALAQQLAESGEIEEAKSLVDRCVKEGIIESIPDDYLQMTTLWTLGSAICECQAVDAAQAYYEVAAPRADLHTSVAGISSNGPVRSIVMRTAALLRRWEEAEQHYQIAREQLSQMRAAPMLALLDQWYSAMLLRRDAPGDRAKALVIAERALVEAQRMGMAKTLKDCLDLKLQLQGVDSRTLDMRTSIDRVAQAASTEPQAMWRQAVAPDGTVTIMFSDIEDSTVLTERLGDQAWQDLLRKHNALIREQLSAYGGYEVKTMGDGFMVAFQSAKKGLDCAIAIQRAFDGHNDTNGEHVKVRIGLHAGEAIKDGDDFYGKNVILASRVAGKAVGGEILVSSLVRALVESSVGAGTFGEPREVELKGLSGTHTVYAVGIGDAR